MGISRAARPVVACSRSRAFLPVAACIASATVWLTARSSFDHEEAPSGVVRHAPAAQAAALPNGGSAAAAEAPEADPEEMEAAADPEPEEEEVGAARADAVAARPTPVGKRPLLSSRRALFFHPTHKMASVSTKSALMEYMSRLNPPEELQTHAEHRSLGPALNKLHEAGNSTFVVANMRNPCAWYVSYWKFRVARRTEVSVESFRRWLVAGKATWLTPFMHLEYVQGVSEGLASRRLSWECQDPSKALGCVAVPKAKKKKKKTLSMGPWFFNESLVDCWVHLEKLDEEAITCFSRWASEAGVDMASMRGGFPEIKHIHDMGSLLEGVSCNDYYTEDLARGVMQFDKEIFNFFNYSSCCGPPDK